MIDDVIIEVLKACFKMEISNEFSFCDDAIIVKLLDGKKVKIAVKEA